MYAIENRPMRVRTHFEERADERGLREDVFGFVVSYGVEHRARGATHVTVIERLLPVWLQGTPEARRARDWVLVFADDGSLVTCYRHRRAAHWLRQKTKRRLSQLERDWRERPPVPKLVPARWRQPLAY